MKVLRHCPHSLVVFHSNHQLTMLSLSLLTTLLVAIVRDYGVTAFGEATTPTASSSAGLFRNPVKDEETDNVYNKIVKTVQVPGLKNGT